MAELSAAQGQLANQVADLKQQLGLDAALPRPSLAQAMAAVGKAQNEVGQVLSQMRTPEPGTKPAPRTAPASARALPSAAQAMSQAAQEITPVAAGDMGRLPAPAEAALQAALDA